MLTEIAPHVAELNAAPRPPRSTSADLSRLANVLARTSLLTVDPDDGTVFVHRWTASELERRCREQGRDEELREFHRRAAEYWRWRFDVWPQDSHAEVHDLLEARYHLLACGDTAEAAALTEHVCLQLEQWGAWDHATTLIHDTLARLDPDSPRRPAWTGQLGNLAYRRGDFGEAEGWYRRSLEIVERLGDQSGMATSWSQLGILSAEKQRYDESVAWHIRALLMRLRLQVPQTAIDARALIALRARMGNEGFASAAGAVLDEEQLAELQTGLDTWESAQSDE